MIVQIETDLELCQSDRVQASVQIDLLHSLNQLAHFLFDSHLSLLTDEIRHKTMHHPVVTNGGHNAALFALPVLLMENGVRLDQGQ